MRCFLLASLCFLLPTAVLSLSTSTRQGSSSTAMSRAQFLSFVGSSSLVAAAAATVSPANAAVQDEKRLNLSNDELKAIVTEDLLDRHFLVSGDLTRSIYDESATFTDEIDTYGMDQWMKGTQKLFVAEGSTFDLVGDVDVNKDRVELRFAEDLMFRIPFRPVVSLTGRLVLKRDESTGLITSYREFWDQDVATVLKSAKFKKG